MITQNTDYVQPVLEGFHHRLAWSSIVKCMYTSTAYNSVAVSTGQPYSHSFAAGLQTQWTYSCRWVLFLTTPLQTHISLWHPLPPGSSPHCKCRSPPSQGRYQ